jgi:hypothetical protein
VSLGETPMRFLDRSLIHPDGVSDLRRYRWSTLIDEEAINLEPNRRVDDLFRLHASSPRSQRRLAIPKSMI